MRVVSAEELRSILSMTAAIDALDAAFAREDPSLAPPMRTTLATPAGTLLSMPAAGDAGVGIKLVTLSEFNPQRDLPFLHAVYVLFDALTQQPEAVIDRTELTTIRTAAVSGLATRYLANPAAARLALFGAGVQAAAHLEAMRAVRPLRDVTVVGRTRSKVDDLVSRARSQGLDARSGAPADVRDADLICTCTTSAVSVFSGHDLDEGVHINAVGAYLADQRELDTETIRRAKVVVETREVALAEAGDVVIPIREGAIDASHLVADLAELARGRPVRTSAADVTAFVSVGSAFEDLVVARAAIEALGPT
jgi:ornithine cyclodeaminase/alanine dehydrogenase-like protein (mu-crystallin family)